MHPSVSWHAARVSDVEREVESRAEMLPSWASAAVAVWQWRDPLLVLGLLAAAGMAWSGVWQVLATFGIFVAGVLGARLASGAHPKPVALKASEHGLTVGGETVPRAQLRQAFVTPVHGAHQLELVRVGPRVSMHLYFTSRDEARRVVQALGLGLDRERQSFKVASWFASSKATLASIAGFAVLLPAVVLPDPPTSVALAIIFSFVLGTSVLRSWSGRLIVGADAIGSEWLWFRRSYLVADLTRVEPLLAEVGQPHRLRLHRRDAGPVDILISSSEEGQKLLEQMTEWVEMAMSMRTRPAPPSFAVWNHAQAAEGPAAQLTALRVSTGDYRGAAFPFSLGELFAVLEDPRALPADRVAAAIAIEARGTDLDRARAGSVAKVTAVPSLSRTLEALAKRDDAALERELAARPQVRVVVEEEPVESEPALSAARRDRP